MTKEQFEIFSNFRSDFKDYCSSLNQQFGEALKPLQIAAAQKDTPEYPLETPVVYNTALDELSQESEIRIIVIGDNPGKDEQLSKNQKYLVGQSGKIAAGFFAKNPEFNTDFRKNAIILNKTPVHTAKTKHIKQLLKNGSEEIKNLISQSQLYMAEKTARLHIDLCNSAGENGIRPELWLVGYAELKGNGLFLKYRNQLKSTYNSTGHGNESTCHKDEATGHKDESIGHLERSREISCWDSVYVFQHFSMNRFSIDLKDFRAENLKLGMAEAAHALGEKHKQEIFG
ncbi:MAG: hypothetical protein KBT11_07855 [Treponema sp.]|nr:hypothetical protein [Candidatus Treponema equifaecale]